MGAVNNILAEAEYNENLSKEGISRVTKYMNTLRSETNKKMKLFKAKIEIGGHILKVNNEMNTLQRYLDLLIESVINAQKGVLQPQVISPVTSMETVIKSVPAFPKDTALPAPLSKDSAQLLLRLCESQVYIKSGILGYVVLLPFVNRGNFNTLRTGSFKLLKRPFPGFLIILTL